MIWLLFICTVCILVLNCLLRNENVPSRARISILKKFISFWIAVLMILLYQLSVDNTLLNPLPTVKLIRYLEPDGNLTDLSDHIGKLQRMGKKSVIFITTTDYSVTQVAALTRLGQSLYPVRDKVKWIVILLPLESSVDNEQVMDNSSGTTFGEAMEMSEDLYQSHMKSLKNLLMRFGTPFVLLRSYEQRALNTSWNGFKWPQAKDRTLKGYQVGLLWALRSLSRGVIMIGGENYGYNSEIFSEVNLYMKIIVINVLHLNTTKNTGNKLTHLL